MHIASKYHSFVICGQVLPAPYNTLILNHAAHSLRKKVGKIWQISANFGITIARLSGWNRSGSVYSSADQCLFCSILQHKLGTERPKLTYKRYLSARNCKHLPKQAVKIRNSKCPGIRFLLSKTNMKYSACHPIDSFCLEISPVFKLR